ncbi:outer membrane protein assembly factor, partial [Thermodesulfobacteriota bacterium]
SGGVFVRLTVKEGPRYMIVFSGNEAFPDRTLKKDLVLFREGNRHGLGVRKSVRQMRERYRRAGYTSVRIQVEEEMKVEDSIETRTVRFAFSEGPLSIVESVSITGNRAVEEETIRKQILTVPPGFLEKGAYVPQTLEDDVHAVKALYAKYGFPGAQVREETRFSEDKTGASVTIDIEEKAQTLVKLVDFEGLSAVSREDASLSLKMNTGEPFREYMLKSDANALSALVSEKGYPHVTVGHGVTFSEDNSEAYVTYTVSEGPRVVLGGVFYSGLFRTRESILARELGMTPDQPFSLAGMLRAQRNIRNLGLFESVRLKPVGLKERHKTVHLFVEVEEKKPYFVEGGLGYESSVGVYANARAGDRNFLGANKNIWLEGETSEIGYRIEAGAEDPRFLGSSVRASLGLFQERETEQNLDFGTVTSGATLGFSRKWPFGLSVGLSPRVERRYGFRTEAADWADENLIKEAEQFEPRARFVLTPSLRYDSRDSFIRPQKGILSSLSVDISKGLDNPLDDFLKYRFDLRTFWTPFSRLTLALIGRIGILDPLGSSAAVPDDELFFLGGTGDVRGFDENMLRFDKAGNPVGGQAFLAGSVEARIDLGRSFEWTFFIDGGELADSFGDMGRESIRFSAGGGLRYITPVGPIGFLYGVKLDRQPGESDGRLHFSIGYTF